MNDGFWQVCVYPSFWLFSFGCTLASRILWLNEEVAALGSMIIICFSGPTFPPPPFPQSFHSLHMLSSHALLSSLQLVLLHPHFGRRAMLTHTHTCLILLFNTWPIFTFQEGNKEGNETLLFTLIFSPSFQNSKSLCIPSPVFLLFFFSFTQIIQIFPH